MFPDNSNPDYIVENQQDEGKIFTAEKSGLMYVQLRSKPSTELEASIKIDDSTVAAKYLPTSQYKSDSVLIPIKKGSVVSVYITSGQLRSIVL